MDTADCIHWPGSVTAGGYGRVGHIYAHRFVWEITNGPIPKGLSVCHTCDNPPCVNPRHLFLGTHAENHKDKDQKGRSNNAAKPRRGVFNGNSKLTDKDVIDIRRRAVIGIKGSRTQRGNLAALAREYSVQPTLIWAVAKRRLWKHVP
jgi:hypothetical protein